MPARIGTPSLNEIGEADPSASGATAGESRSSQPSELGSARNAHPDLSTPKSEESSCKGSSHR